MTIALSSHPLQANLNLEVKEVMSQQEADATGISGMTPSQRYKFEAWLTSWTKKVLSQASTYHTSQTIPAWVESWPDYLNPNSNPHDPRIERMRKQSNSFVFRNFNGKVLELKNGSKWQIVPFDIAIVQYWTRDDVITIQKNKDLSRPYILINETKNKQAAARQLSTPNPTGSRASDPPSYFAESQQLESVGTYGESLLLKDKSKWKVALEDQFRVLNWRPKDRLRIKKQEGMLYHYEIVNLDSGEQINANASSEIAR